MKMLILILVLALAFAWTAAAQLKGPQPDKVYVDTRTQEEIAMKDVAKGKLEVYAIPSGSWSFGLKPCHNQPAWSCPNRRWREI